MSDRSSSSPAAVFAGSVALSSETSCKFFSGLRFAHRDSGVEPVSLVSATGKQRDKVLRHFALLDAELHDQTFLSTHAIHHHAHTVDRDSRIRFGTRRNCLNTLRQPEFSLARMAAACFDGVAARNDVLRAQLSEFSRASSGSMLLSSSAASSSPSSSSSSSSSVSSRRVQETDVSAVVGAISSAFRIDSR